MRPDTFGWRLLALRTQRQLTQKQLSERINVTSAAISRWECGKAYPRRETVALIANVFDVPLSNLAKYPLSHPDLSVLPSLGDRLRTLRKAHALTLRDLAANIAVSSVCVWKWEKSKSYPTTESVERIAERFRVPVSMLTHGN